MRSEESGAGRRAPKTSLAVHRLRLHVSTAGGMGSMPGWGTKIPHAACAKPLQSFCNPMDCGLPGSSVHGILQAKILEGVAISSSSCAAHSEVKKRQGAPCPVLLTAQVSGSDLTLRRGGLKCRDLGWTKSLQTSMRCQGTGHSTRPVLFPIALLHMTKITHRASPPTPANPQYVSWYTEAWSLDPVTIRWLLGDTSQHMTEDLSGTWEGWGAERGTHPFLFLTSVHPFKRGPFWWWASAFGPLDLAPQHPGHTRTTLLPYPGTWTAMVPVGMLKMLTRLSVPTLTHHWPGKRQRGPQSEKAGS